MKLVTGILCLFFSSNLFAHGEDKPGPNGGFIQMPGSFHTELVPEKDGSYKIYLLNLQNQNPTIKDSSVTASIVNGKKKQALKCKPMKTHFHCLAGSAKKTGALIVLAKREGAVGIEAIYNLPLKLNNAEVPTQQGHEGHH